MCRWFADGLMAYLHIGCFIISGWQNIMGINTMLIYTFSYLYSGIALKFLQHYFIRCIIFLTFLGDLVMKKTILAWPVFRRFLIYDFFAVWEEALGYILLVSCSMKLILVKSGFRGILMGKKFGIQERVRAIFSAFFWHKGKKSRGLS
jgi:ABC-type proline/glycine betaine transport system permease subunit